MALEGEALNRKVRQCAWGHYSINVVKTIRKKNIWEWFVPPIQKGDFGDSLLLVLTTFDGIDLRLCPTTLANLQENLRLFRANSSRWRLGQTS